MCQLDSPGPLSLKYTHHHTTTTTSATTSRHHQRGPAQARPHLRQLSKLLLGRLGRSQGAARGGARLGGGLAGWLGFQQAAQAGVLRGAAPRVAAVQHHYHCSKLQACQEGTRRHIRWHVILMPTSQQEARVRGRRTRPPPARLAAGSAPPAPPDPLAASLRHPSAPGCHPPAVARQCSAGSRPARRCAAVSPPPRCRALQQAGGRQRGTIGL